MKLTFPHMGNTYICVKALLDDLGIDYIIPPFNNKKALEMGTKYAPETACLPLKINIGNYIQAYERGADTVLMAGGCGPCRFGYYCEMQREILRDIGYKMDIITIERPDGNLNGILKKIAELAGGIKPFKIINAVKNATIIAKQVDELEKLSYKIRPREIKRGTTDSIFNSFLNKVLLAEGSAGIKKMIERTRERMEQIEIDENCQPIKVGIVGEIYTTIDTYTSFHIEQKLGYMGTEVDRAVTVSGWIIEHILKKAFHLPRDLRYAEAAKPYLRTMIGGHAQETIGNTVLYANKGYDGVIQIFPLTCMPEIVAESILPAVQKDLDMPVLTLIIDEMTGEAGCLTRIEAFIDLIIKRREKPAVDEKWILSGN
jgi:predicted nucleotide-binding protein (sugar kinase/HSP70/actin superfamily)